MLSEEALNQNYQSTSGVAITVRKNAQNSKPQKIDNFANYAQNSKPQKIENFAKLCPKFETAKKRKKSKILQNYALNSKPQKRKK